MKKLLLILSVFCLSNIIIAQNDNLPTITGDNFSLEGALALFKKAKSVEEFEMLINDESNNVNNLDLNNDGKTDYISVADLQQNNAHVLVLSTDLGATEKQDIATINIEKTAIDQATLQIIGDPDLYAENTIVEPFDTTEVIQNAKGPNAPEIEINQIFVNVWFWPSVQFIYSPTYVVWRSPYRWSFYPRWYRPWRPFGYRNFYNRCAPNRMYYRRATVYRVNYSRKFYEPVRNRSSLIIHYNGGRNNLERNNTQRSRQNNFRNNNRLSNHNIGRGSRRR